MYYDGIYTIDEAKQEKLIPLTVWLFQHDLEWLLKEGNRIGSNPIRKAMIVRHNSSYALFVNDMTGKHNKYDENEDLEIVK